MDDTYGKSFAVILEYFDLIGKPGINHRDECIKEFWSQSSKLYSGKTMNPTEFLELSQMISDAEPTSVSSIFDQFFNEPDYMKFSVVKDQTLGQLIITATLPEGATTPYHKFSILFVDTGETIQVDSSIFDPESRSAVFEVSNPNSKVFLADLESRCFATYD